MDRYIMVRESPPMLLHIPPPSPHPVVSSRIARPSPMPLDSHYIAPPSPHALAQLLASALLLAGIGHHLAVVVAVFATILPLLPPITRNVKSPTHTTRLEFSVSAESASETLPKSGKNGNVFRRPSNESGRTVSHPAPALASTAHSWASMPPPPPANCVWPHSRSLHHPNHLPSSVNLRHLRFLCGSSRSLSLPPLRPLRSPRLLLLPRQPAQHRLQDAPVAVVADVNRAIQSRNCRELPRRAVLTAHAHRHLLPRLQLPGDPHDVVRLAACEIQRLPALPRLELQRQDAHPHQIAPVDALVALRQRRPNPQQQRTLCRPVARAARPILLPRNHQQRRPLRLIAHRGIVDRRLLARRQVGRVIPLLAARQQVPQPDVRERPAHHHLVVAASRPIAVEVARRHAMLLQILPCRAGGRDRPRRRDVVRRDRIADRDQHPHPRNVHQRRRLRRQPL